MLHCLYINRFSQSNENASKQKRFTKSAVLVYSSRTMRYCSGKKLYIIIHHALIFLYV